jgi:hypothetical protein
MTSASTRRSQTKATTYLMTLVTSIPLPNTLSSLTCHTDKSLLHDGSPRTYEPGTPRFTLPPRGLYSRERPVIPSSLLINTPNHQQHPINVPPVFGDMHARFRPEREDPRLQSLLSSKPTAFFHGISESMQRQLEKQSPTPPRKIGTFRVSDTPGLLPDNLTTNSSTICLYSANT